MSVRTFTLDHIVVTNHIDIDTCTFLFAAVVISSSDNVADFFLLSLMFFQNKHKETPHARKQPNKKLGLLKDSFSHAKNVGAPCALNGIQT
jgi:hypothetical protein